MHIIVVGVDHTSAPIAFRERLACSPRQVSQVLRISQQVVQEGILLSTCNRIELYGVCSESSEGVASLLQVLSEARDVALSELQSYCYSFVDEQAVSHLFGVTSGLYSLVPGEPQIQGQVADALEVAQGGGYAGPVTSALFRAALATGKRARSETGISRNATSISHVAVQLARQVFPKLNEACVLLVGSGQMSELAARNLCDNGAQRLVIMNRTQSHAIDLAQRFGALHRTFPELPEALVEADVVISSTTAPRAIITYELMCQVMNGRSGRSLLVSTFERWLRSLSVVDTISDLRQYADMLRQQELVRAMRQLSPSLSEREEAAVRELTTRLVNKLLHTPMLRLKDAAVQGQGHLYAEAIRYLFDLEGKANEASYDRNEGQQAGYDTDTPGDRAITTALAELADNHRADSHCG